MAAVVGCEFTYGIKDENWGFTYLKVLRVYKIKINSKNFQLTTIIRYVFMEKREMEINSVF